MNNKQQKLKIQHRQEHQNMNFYLRISILVVVCGLTLIEPFRLSAQEATSTSKSNTDGSTEPQTPSPPRPPPSSPASPPLQLDNELVAPSELFNNTLVLIEPDIFLIYWSYNTSHIRFEIHAKTYGWFSFGVQFRSLVDYVIGYVNDDGSAHFSDRHRWSSSSMNDSQVDARQDAMPLYAAKTNSYTVIKFVRPLLSCADEQSAVNTEDVDVFVGASPVMLVYSMGEVYNGEIVYYEMQKGQKEVNLVDMNPEDLLPRVKIFEISFNQ